jgi:predicted metal-binding membrane protein
MWPRVRDERLFLAVMAGLVVLAWASLWIWKESPYGRFLSHEENDDVAGLGTSYLVLVLLFVAGWTLMTVAMMLPTSLPLVAFFRSFVRTRPDRALLVALLVVGYLAVWTAFAFAVHVGDLGLHRVVERSGWLEANAWTIVAGTFLFAGIYQFSPLKYKCLDKCRSPMSFVMGHWRGGNEHVQALRLGAHHGLFCIGCCWSLMLIMFAVGVGSLGWMLVLAIVMTVEKNMPWGRHLSAPLGAVLVLWGLTFVALGVSGRGGIT